MIKFKADNLGCGDCRMKAVSGLIASGAKKVSFDVPESYIYVEEGNLTTEQCIALIEKESIFIEGVVKDSITYVLEFQEADVKLLSSTLAHFNPVISLADQTITIQSDADVYDFEDLIGIYGYSIKDKKE
jgi:hypothetical protein